MWYNLKEIGVPTRSSYLSFYIRYTIKLFISPLVDSYMSTYITTRYDKHRRETWFLLKDKKDGYIINDRRMETKSIRTFILAANLHNFLNIRIHILLV
jgi:hypothetical protein